MTVGARDGEVVNGIRIAAVQLNARAGEKAANNARVKEAVIAACDAGAELVVLPELVNTGYALRSRKEALALAEPVPDGETVAEWAELARSHGAYICGGVAERDGAALYNTAALVSPEGFVGRYRKLHLYETERLIFEPGDEDLEVFQTPAGRIGLMICYDAWHWEVATILKLLGADLILNPTCWSALRSPEWQAIPTTVALHIGLAHVTRTFIASASHAGEDRGRRYLGSSCIAGPEGLVAPIASSSEPATVTADVDLADARNHRWVKLSDQIADRRIDVYDAWLGYRPRHAPAGRTT
jgi:predicted amidohydrolase